ncbi:MAG: hypothetical protein AB2L14_26700 [Candidatus Xenobiia bacterium LiM19]
MLRAVCTSSPIARHRLRTSIMVGRLASKEFWGFLKTMISVEIDPEKKKAG